MPSPITTGNPEADTPSQRALAKVLNDPRDAFVYFRQGTGSIEVLQKTLQRPDGCMCRIYFRIPDLCQGGGFYSYSSDTVTVLVENQGAYITSARC